MIKAASLCNTCYDAVPAQIVKDHGAVWIEKICPEHGHMRAMIERDPKWYDLCQKFDNKIIYEGIFIDITNKCNIKCKYCYHDNTGHHKALLDIYQEARTPGIKPPYILTGGEPTLHPQLPRLISELSSLGETVVVTNGVELCDEAYLDTLCRAGMLVGDTLCIGLSFHEASNGKDLALLELCREKGYKIGTTLYVIDCLEDIDRAVALYRANRDVICNMRIKAATNLWKEQNAKTKLFTSDILNYLKGMGEISIDASRCKLSFADIRLDGMHIMAVSWYDKKNVNVLDISCPPWYRAKDGELYNLVTACLLNERPE